jgi:hypothetical protein
MTTSIKLRSRFSVGGRRESHVDIGMQRSEASQPRNEPESDDAAQGGTPLSVRMISRPLAARGGGMTREKAVDPVMNARQAGPPKGWVLVVLPEQVSGAKDSSS